MEIVINHNKEEMVIALTGRLDTVTSLDLLKAFNEEDIVEPVVTVDMKNLEYISSAGLRALLSMKKELKTKDKALEVANLKAMNSPKQPMRVLRYKPGRATDLLVRCKYFETSRMIINTERNREMADFRTGSSSFQVLLCYSGCGVLFDETNNESINFFKGDCIFVPANSYPLKIHGKAELLRVRC